MSFFTVTLSFLISCFFDSFFIFLKKIPFCILILSFLCASLKNVFRNLNYSLKKKIFFISLFSVSFHYFRMFSMCLFFSLFSRSGWICFFFSFFFFYFLQIFFSKKELCFKLFFCCFFLFYFLVVFFAVENPFPKTWKYLFSAFLSNKRLFLPISFLEIFVQNNVPFVCFCNLGFWIPSYCFSFCLLLKKSWHILFFLSLALLQSVFIFIICFCFFFSFVSFVQKKKEKYWNIFFFFFNPFFVKKPRFFQSFP